MQEVFDQIFHLWYGIHFSGTEKLRVQLTSHAEAFRVLNSISAGLIAFWLVLRGGSVLHYSGRWRLDRSKGKSTFMYVCFCESLRDVVFYVCENLKVQTGVEWRVRRLFWYFFASVFSWRFSEFVTIELKLFRHQLGVD